MTENNISLTVAGTRYKQDASVVDCILY